MFYYAPFRPHDVLTSAVSSQLRWHVGTLDRMLCVNSCSAHETLMICRHVLWVIHHGLWRRTELRRPPGLPARSSAFELAEQLARRHGRAAQLTLQPNWVIPEQAGLAGRWSPRLTRFSELKGRGPPRIVPAHPAGARRPAPF